MFHEDNYRFCTKLSLQILRGQRERLSRDSSIEKDVDLYTALHEMEPSVRNIRFQYYIVKWFDGHWSALQSLLEHHPEYTIDQRRQITLFFAERFVGLLDKLSESASMANLGIPDLLKVRRTVLREMIEMTEKWEKNTDTLRLQMKKHEEQYRALIARYDENQ